MQLSYSISWQNIMLHDAKNFFASMLSNLWNDFVQDDDDEEITKQKVIDFTKPSHVVKFLK